MSPYANRPQSVASDPDYESLSLHSSSETLVAPAHPGARPSGQSNSMMPQSTFQTSTPFTYTTPSQSTHDHEALVKTKRKRIPLDDILGPLAITFFFVLLVVGFGALIGYCDAAIGCLALKNRTIQCKGTGALGGIFASAPATLGFFGIRWIYHTLDNRRRHHLSALAIIILLPLLCIGFGIASVVIGWAILSRTDPTGIQFGIGKAVAISAIGSSCSCIIVSLAIGRLLVGP